MFTIIVVFIVANTLITIYLYPSQRPDFWWIPGAWVWFKFQDLLISLNPYPTDSTGRRRYPAPRIA